MRILLIAVCSLLFFGLLCENGHAGFIFYNPAYHGKIIDHETKEPLEGVVVVALYSTKDIIGGPGGPSSDDRGAREAVTDENGMFTIPPFITLVSPISNADYTRINIFKPGYSSLQFGKVLPIALCRNHDRETNYFPRECLPPEIFTKKIGTRQKVIIDPRTKETITITNGIMELVKLKTLRERTWALESVGFRFKLPHLQEAYDKEVEWLRNHREKRLIIHNGRPGEVVSPFLGKLH